MRIMGIDIETYSSAPLPKCGVYRYTDSPDFEILLFSYAFDDEPVATIDLACGEQLPEEVLSALENPEIIKAAWNAQFERVCLSRYLGHLLDPHQWHCTAVMSAYLTMPARLADAAVALKLTQQKMEEGKELIRYFSVPCKPTKANGGRTRNMPGDAPDKWAVYKKYNAQDVETERDARKKLEQFPVPEQEWELYALDQTINDRGVRIDKALVKSAIAVDSEFSARAYQQAQQITGLDNPGSVAQLKAWLADQDVPMESLAKKLVKEKAAETEGIVSELLNLRLELSKTSVKKYEAMARSVCRDGRVRGTLQFYGANRTGRWSGRLVQLQNVPQNHLPDLDLAREIVKCGETDMIEMLYTLCSDASPQTGRGAGQLDLRAVGVWRVRSKSHPQSNGEITPDHHRAARARTVDRPNDENSDGTRYLYLTRRHVEESLADHRRLLRRGRAPVLDPETLRFFASALMRMRYLRRAYVIWLYPKKRFPQIVREYGYPVVSKDIAKSVYYARKGSNWALMRFEGKNPDGSPSKWYASRQAKWKKLLDAPFKISDECCHWLKEKPLQELERAKKPFIGLMAEESDRRQAAYLQTGCNAYHMKKPSSKPMGFWTEQDVLRYLLNYNVPYAKDIYGEIVERPDGRLTTTLEKRTGCYVCAFGQSCRAAKGSESRYQRLKRMHPKQYEYCMRPIEEYGLGMKPVLDFLEIPYE